MQYSFAQKLHESEDTELRKVMVAIYKHIFAPVHAVEYIEDRTFQKTGCDLRLTFKATQCGDDYHETVEEKIRSAATIKYPDILIETISNKEIGNMGWIYSSKADWLNYVKNNIPERLESIILPMRPLSVWFRTMGKGFETREATTRCGDREYTTVNKVVPLDNDSFKRFCESNGMFRLNVTAEQIGRILKK